MAASTKPANTSPEAKVDEIIEILKRMDRRDKLRTIGGFFRAIIALIPIILLISSGWYFAGHYAEIMKTISDQAASSAAHYTQTQSQSLFDQFTKGYSFPGSRSSASK